MQSDTLDSNMDALISWAFDLPPFAAPCPHTIDGTSIQFGTNDQIAWVSHGNTRHIIVGVMASGWMSVAGLGYRLYQGDGKPFERIARACNTTQTHLLEHRADYDAAVHRHQMRRGPSFVAGLKVVDLGDGRPLVRLQDIASPEIRSRFSDYLHRHHQVFDDAKSFGHFQGPMSPGYADLIAWEMFAQSEMCPSKAATVIPATILNA